MYVNSPALLSPVGLYLMGRLTGTLTLVRGPRVTGTQSQHGSDLQQPTGPDGYVEWRMYVCMLYVC